MRRSDNSGTTDVFDTNIKMMLFYSLLSFHKQIERPISFAINLNLLHISSWRLERSGVSIFRSRARAKSWESVVKENCYSVRPAL